MESVNCDICILHDAKEESVTIVSAKAHKVIVRKYKKADDEVNYTRWLQAGTLSPIQKKVRFGTSAIYTDEI